MAGAPRTASPVIGSVAVVPTMTVTPEPPPDAAPPTGVQAPGRQSGAAGVLAEAEAIVDDVVERAFDPEDLASMDGLDQPRRLLLVHAHPDDESIGNGATMARYALAGAGVTLVTCTRGERGEVVDASVGVVEGEHAALADLRVMELATAMEALDVGDHRFLDDAPLVGEDAAATAAMRYEDSGMAWAPGEGVTRAVPAPDTPATAFARADLRDAAARLAGVLREVRPQVVITYEAGGGYGHPDHVRAAAVTAAALDLAADPDAPGVIGAEPWTVGLLAESVIDASAMPAGAFDGGATPTMVVPAEEVDVVVDAPEQLGAKVAALRAHRSQVKVREHEGEWQLNVSGEHWMPVWTSEAYRIARGPARAPGSARGSDLFAGLA